MASTSRWLGLATAAALALVVLHVLEAGWPALGWWAFVLLSLTLGFGHGALDGVLLVAQFKPLGKAIWVGGGYLLCVLVAALVLSQSTGLALLALLLMSLWHFGQAHNQSMLHRIGVGGASVMWPVLLASQTLGALLAPVLGDSFGWVWPVWRGLAWLWLAVAVVSLLKTLLAQQPLAVAAEVASVGLLYLVLSPLLAFALFFGLYHCGLHIRQVHEAVRRNTPSTGYNKWQLMALLVTLVATAALMAVLWTYLAQPAWRDTTLNTQVLQWIIVALAAVTLPHLVLISASARWLQPES